MVPTMDHGFLCCAGGRGVGVVELELKLKKNIWRLLGCNLTVRVTVVLTSKPG